MRRRTALVALLTILVMAAGDSMAAKILVGEAMVESIEVLVFEPFPVQVRVIAYGNLPDGCTRIGKIEDSRSGGLFTVRIATTRPANRMCTQALTEFQETLPLNTTGLKAGTYTVDVNGIRQTFTLRSDNTAP